MQDDHLAATQNYLRKRTSGERQSGRKFLYCSKRVRKAAHIFQLMTVTAVSNCPVVSPMTMLSLALEANRKARPGEKRVDSGDPLP